MEKYDVLAVGGGIAGSVGAKLAARKNLDTLLIEKKEVPRHKTCSGIQFPYFEDLIGSDIPESELCDNELFKVEMVSPDDEVLNGKMQMLNFWRKPFDHWLNKEAEKAGAVFKDETEMLDFKKYNSGFKVQLDEDGKEKEVKTKYLLGADGGYSPIRRKLRPQDFKDKSEGAAINLYFKGDSGQLDPNTLYMIHKKKYSDWMFSWVYKKDDDWIIGTGAKEAPMETCMKFYEYIQEQYGIEGKIVDKKGFASEQAENVYLGKENLLMTGDAAGLVDLYRGVGMDAAALSARLAAKSFKKAEKSGKPAMNYYQKYMKRIVKQKRKHDKIQKKRYESDERLKKSLSKTNMMKDGLKLLFYSKVVNKLLPTDRMILLPP
ncbi:MAG: NAD(P)/FAD-dependent oxidoreductase [Candidatus Thermoplasmatota archaeon]|nr:NAD(P)/FAD-dependent oxidoreductase [Candidatus Thermoplasmatota archaeon]